MSPCYHLAIAFILNVYPIFFQRIHQAVPLSAAAINIAEQRNVADRKACLPHGCIEHLRSNPHNYVLLCRCLLLLSLYLSVAGEKFLRFWHEQAFYGHKNIVSLIFI